MATDPTYDPKATVFDELGTEALRGKGDIYFFFILVFDFVSCVKQSENIKE